MENALERAVVLCDGDLIQPAHLPAALAVPAPAAGEKAAGISIPGSRFRDVERVAILRTIEAAGGSNARAAQILGISVRKIQYRLREWGLARPRAASPLPADGSPAHA
jgi:two-component system NtrC family response regulator/two-component system response regulator HydG